MLRPSTLNKGEIVVMNRAHIDYEKLEVLTQREMLYMKKNEEESEIQYYGELYIPD